MTWIGDHTGSDARDPPLRGAQANRKTELTAPKRGPKQILRTQGTSRHQEQCLKPIIFQAILQGMEEPALHRGPVTYISPTFFAALRLHRRVSNLMAIGCAPWSSLLGQSIQLGTVAANRNTPFRYILSCYISCTSYHQL